MTAAEKILRAHDLESQVFIIQLSRIRGVPRSIELLFKQTGFWSVMSTDDFRPALSFQFNLSDPVLWGKAACEMLKLI